MLNKDAVEGQNGAIMNPLLKYLITPIPNFVPIPRIILIILNILAIKYIIIPYG